LRPVLKKMSLEHRKNLWTLLIKPLFEQLTLLYDREHPLTNRERVETLIRASFKKFLYSKNVKSDIVDLTLRLNVKSIC